MALAESLPLTPSASVAATGLGIRYIGTDPTFAYAYSGAVNTANENVEVTSLEFTTGSGFVLTSFQFHNNQTTGDDIHFTLYLNSLVVFGITMQYSGTDKIENPPTAILIPPFTEVKVTVANATQDAARETLTTMTGRVYGAG